MSTWELIVDGALDGATNMAIDAGLLQEVDSSVAPRTIVRFYQWDRPTLSLGRHQKIDMAVDVGFCEANGIAVVHRPTGGRAVLHDDELTYAVISNDASCFGDTIYGNYKRVSEALCLGFHRLGVPAVLAPETRKPNHGEDDLDLPCFVSPSRYELTVDGRKIVGSAQRRVRKTFLQHGSMPVTCRRELLARSTGMSNPAVLHQEMAGLAEYLPERPSLDRFRNILIDAFQDFFEIEFKLRTPQGVTQTTIDH
jgi:lipoate-protein ligase A